MDFLSGVIVDEGNVRGVFLVPKTSLVQHGIFAAGERGGIVSFQLYLPPDSPKLFEWQRGFYIDLSDPAKLSDSRRLFLRILRDN